MGIPTFFAIVTQIDEVRLELEGAWPNLTVTRNVINRI